MLPIEFGQAPVLGELLEDDQGIARHLLIGMAPIEVALEVVAETFQGLHRQLDGLLSGLVEHLGDVLAQDDGGSLELRLSRGPRAADDEPIRELALETVERVHDSDSREGANRVSGQPDWQAHCSTYNIAARSLDVIDEVDTFIVLVLRAEIEDCVAWPEIVRVGNPDAGLMLASTAAASSRARFGVPRKSMSRVVTTSLTANSGALV